MSWVRERERPVDAKHIQNLSHANSDAPPHSRLLTVAPGSTCRGPKCYHQRPIGGQNFQKLRLKSEISPPRKKTGSLCATPDCPLLAIRKRYKSRRA
jgi:hypothetical protein